MEVRSKEWVNEYLYRRLLNVIPDSIEAGEVANALQDEVMQDIAGTADPDNWHSGDIDIALARVMKKRLLSTDKDSFPIVSVSRADLEDKGYDTSEVDDATMERLASKLGDAYVENGFWIDLPIMADYLEIPKKEEN